MSCLTQPQALQFSHKVYDAVHGFIRFNALEKRVIDSEPFQRLHGIHQLGIAYLVYPGATHSRFEHSLGTMHLATQIFERIGLQLPDAHYWRQIIRLAALCHDLGHLPFSHDAEDVLLGDAGHEGWTRQILLSLSWDEVEQTFPGRSVTTDILKMAIGEKHLPDEVFSPLERVLSQVVTGDFFGADRIDYLLRDAQCTGVSHGCFDYQQLIEMLTILTLPGRLELGIEENGISSCEALLLARHFMHKRVYQYVSVKVYKFHLGRFMKRFFERGDYLSSVESYLSLSDPEILTAMRKESVSDPDAAALMQRGKRFRALLLEEGIAEDLQLHLEAVGIPPAAFFIEAPSAPGKEVGLSFFVQSRSQKILPASAFSNIRLENKKERWIYVDPAFEKSVGLHLV